MGFKRLKRTLEQMLPELLMFGELPLAAVPDEGGNDGLLDRVWTEVGQAMLAHTQLWKGSVELLPLVMKPFIRQGLTHLYPSEAIDALVDEIREGYRALEPSVKRQATIGADLTVHLAAITIAMYRVLMQKGHSRQEATQLVADIVWRAYSKMGGVPWIMSGRVGQDSYQRLRFCVDAFLTFPFGSPAYQWENVEGGERVCAFNITRCPVAEYFHAQGLDALCVQTWCNQDFPLARQWGGATLERTGTLAGGAPSCDFRWHAKAAREAGGGGKVLEEAPQKESSQT
jgi:ubiquinone biosynthesis protein